MRSKWIGLDGKHNRTAECSKSIGMAIAGSMEGFGRKKVWKWGQSFLRSVPLKQNIPFSLSLLTIMPKSNFQVCFFFFYGYWCLFFIFVSLFSLLWLYCVLFPLGLSPVTLSDSFQMDVVSAFQSGTSFQGALRRQASNSSQQQHDVTNVSSPTHVAFTATTTTATAANTASATVGCECVFSSSAWDFFFSFSLLFF